MVWQKPKSKIEAKAKPVILQVVDTLDSGIALLKEGQTELQLRAKPLTWLLVPSRFTLWWMFVTEQSQPASHAEFVEAKRGQQAC